MIKMVLTIPGFKHVVDEEVVKPDLGFWDRASRPVELGHHNGQALADIIGIIIIVIRRKTFSSHLGLLIVCLGEILLSDPFRPHSTMLQRSSRVGHIGTLDQHPEKSRFFQSCFVFGPPAQDGLDLWTLRSEFSPLVEGGLRVVHPTEGCAELVDMHKVLRHVGSQYNVDQPLPEHLVRLRVELLEDVHPVVRVGELEAEGGVVILEDGGVVVEDRQLTPRVAEECRVPSGVVNVVDNGTNQADRLRKIC